MPSLQKLLGQDIRIGRAAKHKYSLIRHGQ
jgi:hypothetical protein